MARTLLRWTPVQSALPTRSPPTSLLTHAIVTYWSNSGIASSWAYVNVSGWSIMPVTVSCHVEASTWGMRSAVSVR